jgi:DNA-binding transcriptional LysR family regulator
MDKFNSLKMFVSAFEHGSFGAAASALGSDPSTVSKAIRRLEQQLQYQLFHRTTRKLQITPAGLEYLETVKKILLELDECEQHLASNNEAASGTLKLNLPVSYGRCYILPLLPAFSAKYPDIKLQVTFSDEYIDIIEQGIDISIRTGTVSDSGLIMQQLSPMDFLICAAPSYLESRDRITTLNQLNHQNWIRYRFKQTGRVMPLLLNQTAPVNWDEKQHDQYIVDDGQALIGLCEAGLGLIQAPHFLLHKSLQQGSVKPIFAPVQPEGFGVYLLYPKRHFPSRKVTAFIEYLKQSLANMGETTHHTWARDLDLVEPQPAQN